MRISKEPSSLQIMVAQKQLVNVEYFNYLGSTLTNNTRYILQIKSRIVMAKAALNIKKIIFIRKLYLNVMKKLAMCYI
jgi:hypothetical protein